MFLRKAYDFSALLCHPELQLVEEQNITPSDSEIENPLTYFSEADLLPEDIVWQLAAKEPSSSSTSSHIDPTQLRAYRGLLNVQNYCFANAIIQQLYMIPSIRERILQWSSSPKEESSIL